MGRYAVTFARLIKNNQFMTTKTMKEKATELLQRCEVVTLASVNKEGYPRPVPMSKTWQKEFPLSGCLPEQIH